MLLIHTFNVVRRKNNSQSEAAEALKKSVPADTNFLRYNSDYLQNHHEARSILSAARSLYRIFVGESVGDDAASNNDDSPSRPVSPSPDEKSQVEQVILQMVSNDVESDTAAYKSALKFMENTLKSSDNVRDEFLTRVRAKMPLAWDFMPEEQLVKRREAWAEEDAKQANGQVKK